MFPSLSNVAALARAANVDENERLVPAGSRTAMFSGVPDETGFTGGTISDPATAASPSESTLMWDIALVFVPKYVE